MIHCVTYNNLGKYSKLFQSQFRLRHEAFIERQGYEVKTYEGMEYDQYDTPATVYLIYADDAEEEALGISRFMPTEQGCMLADLWPELVKDKSILGAKDIWESTRFAIKRDLPPETRRRICHELCSAHIEFGLENDIAMIIGLMPTLILRSVYERSGVTLERLGDSYEIGKHSRVQAAGIPINFEQVVSVWKKTGVSNTLLGAKYSFDLADQNNQLQFSRKTRNAA
ncbi:MAG: acyl-homoserine-lactone synthase [Alphaproteobacteria bacterium]|nr:acyl-homoserine-lactone synthase [Alphaproteobacteria bacterium]